MLKSRLAFFARKRQIRGDIKFANAVCAEFNGSLTRVSGAHPYDGSKPPAKSAHTPVIFVLRFLTIEHTILS